MITTKAEKQKKVVGPELPGSTQASGSSEKRESLSEESDDDDDDGYGPMPLPSNLREKEGGINEGVREFLEKEERRKKMAEVNFLYYIVWGWFLTSLFFLHSLYDFVL